MRNLVFTLVFLCSFLPAFSTGWKWFNPANAAFPVIQNQGFKNELKGKYTRLPDRAKNLVSNQIWQLSRSSSGLAIHFYSDAPVINIRYQVTGPLAKPHMPATGVSGIDLYRIDSDGKYNVCSADYSFGDTISFKYDNLGRDPYHNLGFEYRIYLPLYNEVKWMEIGIPEQNSLAFVPRSGEIPIVIYGASIAQGACASRPSKSWANLVQRQLDLPVINLGFSGNGKLDKEVVDFINEIDARVYVLDCVTQYSLTDDYEIYRKITASVKKIRTRHSTSPILLVEHPGYGNWETDTTVLAEYDIPNKICRKAYLDLKSEGIKELYYLSRKELNIPEDCRVDCVHLNDLGMQQEARIVENKIRNILHLTKGELATTQAVTQRRNLRNYEWMERHLNILKEIRKKQPKAIILGNSIIHFWGGQPTDCKQNGVQSWNKIMEPAGFMNLGYGWDKIENVLWRIYHGELDGYQPQKIIVMIGTNNLGIDSDADLVAGLHFLLSEIRHRQPLSEITMVGILPCRNMEDHIKSINSAIRDMALDSGYKYKDIGNGLLLDNGKINEDLFTDGLHPNDKGYSIIAPFIVQ